MTQAAALTSREINSLQGTRLSDKAPWETYASEMNPRLDQSLADAVSEYSTKRHDDRAGTQTKEELCRLREENRSVSREYQWLSPEEYSDFDARIGVVKSHSDLIVGLRKMGVSCFYRQHVHPDKAVLYIVANGIESVGAWVQIGPMPELSIMNFDARGVPLSERRRGWRTVLLQLILKGVIKERETNIFFGKPRLDKAFSRYNGTLQSFRNIGSLIV